MGHKYLFIFAILCSFTGPAAAQTARPAALSPVEFEARVEASRRAISAAHMNAGNCAEVLSRESRAFFETTHKRFPNVSQLEAKVAARDDVVTKLFQARLAATKRFRELVVGQEFSDAKALESCGFALKQYLRTLRGWEDIWGLQALYEMGRLEGLREEAQHGDVASHIAHKFSRSWPDTLVNPDSQSSFSFPSTLRSGDVLLSRGNTFTGAVISRIGSIDNQFSHIAFVYKADGRLTSNDSRGNRFVPGSIYVVEAVLNEGLRVVPLNEYLSDGKSRAVVYRYRNLDAACGKSEEEIAALAAEKMAKKASETKTAYNFSMEIPLENLGEESSHFCSQTVGVGFTLAFRELGCGRGIAAKYLDPKRLEFPILYTPFNPEGNALVRTLGLRVHETFAPADAEIDPRLDLVAEWRDFGAIQEARYYDMTLTQIFEWMEHANYHFQNNMALKAIAEFGQFMAASAEKMPENTPPAYVEGTMLMFVMMETSAKLNLPLLMAENNIEAVMNRFEAFLRTTRGMDSARISEIRNVAREQIVKLRNRRGLSTLAGMAENMNFTHAPPGESEPRKLFFTDRQLEIALEAQRSQDCQRFKRGEEPLFHDFLRADFGANRDAACPSDIVRWWDRRGVN